MSERGCPEPSVALTSPSAERNKGPILEILRQALPAEGSVLEVASGTGEHVAHFASALATSTWQPSDPDAECRRSVAAWVASRGLANVSPPLDLDVHRRPWPITARFDALVCINMIHIAPWSATQALFSGAREALGESGVMVLYGPYRVAGVETAASNDEFDRSLRMRNPQWGLRDLDEVVQVARANGFDLADRVEMPANNLSLIFRRASAA